MFLYQMPQRDMASSSRICYSIESKQQAESTQSCELVHKVLGTFCLLFGESQTLRKAKLFELMKC